MNATPIPLFKRIAYPLVTLVVLLAAWSAAIAFFKVPDYLLPSPMQVLSAMNVGYVQGAYWPHFLFTMKSVLAGYVAGCSLAIACGILLAESPTFELFVYPYIVALQSMPKIAIAPLIIVWLGFGIESKIVMVALVCFFPLFINTSIGIKQANPQLIDVMRAFGASKSMIFLRVKLPSAAGHIFAGLQIGVVLALIGAVVAEFVASTHGLGHIIKAAAVDMQTNVMFAALLSLAALGVAGSQLLRWLHAKVVFWDRAAATSATTPQAE